MKLDTKNLINVENCVENYNDVRCNGKPLLEGAFYQAWTVDKEYLVVKYSEGYLFNPTSNYGLDIGYVIGIIPSDAERGELYHYLIH